MWRFDFTCACGDRWSGTAPKSFKGKEKEYLAYVLAAWKKKHGEHISKTVWPK